jgi:hypothetical protein
VPIHRLWLQNPTSKAPLLYRQYNHPRQPRYHPLPTNQPLNKDQSLPRRQLLLQLQVPKRYDNAYQYAEFWSRSYFAITILFYFIFHQFEKVFVKVSGVNRRISQIAASSLEEFIEQIRANLNLESSEVIQLELFDDDAEEYFLLEKFTVFKDVRLAFRSCCFCPCIC